MKKASLKINDAFLTGRSTRIRTLDPLLPKQMRYRAALHSEKTALLFRYYEINGLN